MAQHIAGRWFDGRSSRPQPVSIHFRATPGGPTLVLRRAGEAADALELAYAQVGWPEMWSAPDGGTVRTLTVDLHEYGSLEVDDAAQWHAAWMQAGGKPTLAERMQTRWRTLALVLCVSLAIVWAFYRWGTPWAAAQIAAYVPADVEREFGQRIVTELDAKWLQPSKLAPERRAALQARFDALTRGITPEQRRYAGNAPAFELHFRRGIGPNAFALPGGAIILSDEMVEVAGPTGDEALTGVLAHEIGHVIHRHTTRIVVEQGVLNIGLGLAMGDVSAVVALAASTFTGLAYSRSHETEADCFAVAAMRHSGMSTAPLGQLLLDAERSHFGRDRGQPNTLERFLSSHPATVERAQMLKQGRVPGCS